MVFLTTMRVNGEKAMCGHIKNSWSRGNIVRTDIPTGLWLSERCETRPGPEFLLRKYRFLENNEFEVVQYYYEDPGCFEPLYVMVAKGRMVTSQPSWLIIGAQDGEYELQKVTIIPYSKEVAKKLAHKINQACLNVVLFPWEPMEKYDIMHVKSESEEGQILIDRDCTSALNWSLHELQLFMIQTQAHHHSLQRELLLGDIHSDPSSRQIYRPTGFQDPLVERHSSLCAACRKLLQADVYHPPRLHYRAHQISRNIIGDWLSLRCETRPDGIFLTRHIRFNNDETWRGVFTHYKDAACKKSSFSIYAEGSFENQGKSKIVKGAANYKFKTHLLKIRPEDSHMVSFLNSEKSGGCSEGIVWKKGIERTIESTTGCKALSLKAPYIEFDIVSIEQYHHRLLLHLGQRSTEGRLLTSPHDRPTSYQSPLIKCDQDKVKAITVNQNILKTQVTKPDMLYAVQPKQTLNGSSSVSSSNAAAIILTFICFVIVL